MVESNVNDPDTGDGAPTVVGKLIVNVVMVSAWAGAATRASKPNAASANFVVFMAHPRTDRLSPETNYQLTSQAIAVPLLSAEKKGFTPSAANFRINSLHILGRGLP